MINLLINLTYPANWAIIKRITQFINFGMHDVREQHLTELQHYLHLEWNVHVPGASVCYSSINASPNLYIMRVACAFVVAG